MVLWRGYPSRLTGRIGRQRSPSKLTGRSFRSGKSLSADSPSLRLIQPLGSHDHSSQEDALAARWVGRVPLLSRRLGQWPPRVRLDKMHLCNPDQSCLLGGTSRTGCANTVVCLNDAIVHDASRDVAGVVCGEFLPSVCCLCMLEEIKHYDGVFRDGWPCVLPTGVPNA